MEAGRCFAWSWVIPWLVFMEVPVAGGREL